MELGRIEIEVGRGGRRKNVASRNIPPRRRGTHKGQHSPKPWKAMYPFHKNTFTTQPAFEDASGSKTVCFTLCRTGILWQYLVTSCTPQQIQLINKTRKISRCWRPVKGDHLIWLAVLTTNCLTPVRRMDSYVHYSWIHWPQNTYPSHIPFLPRTSTPSFIKKKLSIQHP